MHTPFRIGLAAAAVGLIASSVAVVGTAGATPATTATGATRACAATAPGYASCDALVATTASGQNYVSRNASAGTTVVGYRPADLQSAYKLTASVGKTGTVAIVDAFHDPNAEADLGVYRKQFGLPACTKANGCFKQLNQNGAASPVPSCAGSLLAQCQGWGEEMSLDVDMVSAICPHCKIILVEATTNSFANLGVAAAKAATLSHIVSNSYGGQDTSSSPSLAHFCTKAGVVQVASSGDHNFNGDGAASGPQIPAAFQSVTSVGGTKLVKTANARGWTESVWKTSSTEGANSGCSVSIAKPAWQHDTICKKRMIADVSAVADPATGVAVYDTFLPSTANKGWLKFGGTSAASPIIASVYALAGNAASLSNASHAYANTTHLFDVTTGNNGTCAGNYECTAKPGYDGPTGLGTPNGVAAF